MVSSEIIYILNRLGLSNFATSFQLFNNTIVYLRELINNTDILWNLYGIEMNLKFLRFKSFNLTDFI